MGDDTVCRLEATSQALDAGVRRPAIPVRTPALVVGDSLAYMILTREDASAEQPWRVGAAGYGPEGSVLAHRLVTHVDAWGADRTSVPTMTIYATAVPVGGHAIAKNESVMVLT